MKHLFYSLFLILTVSCSKSDTSDYATESSERGIIGKWRLVEVHSSDGTPQVNKVDVSSENYVVVFDANGNVESVDFPCVGKYNFDSNASGNLGNNLVVTFDKCKSNKSFSYSINGLANARISDYNYLILNVANCDEPCTRVYRRLK
ncbi:MULTISPECIES: hypothetical protein [Capnocytophaga]|uniref:hypothetical protein n=1 Tax=Capnocytophaga TaxID=1016 RepID=UPI000BB1E01C|nr:MULTISPECIES: hypothetical protein [Capnocytophaga]ATA73460.1 hypothetical protein CGC49_09345 [Capnocytophaga sp. H4358]